MAAKEEVVKLGVEGGGFTIFRTLAGSGWSFHVEGSSMFFTDNDDEDWRFWTTEPVETIEEALRSVARDGSWVILCPIRVHPEYRAKVWEFAQITAGALPQHLGGMWTRKSEAWKRRCLEQR